jgi:hypothetical protein
MSGWIKLHKGIKSHWIFVEKRKFSRFEAWVDILLTVNYSFSKTLIKGKLIEVNRGESVRSLDTWAKNWGWDKSSVRRYFDLLKNDGMIQLENETVTTRLIVCNYDSYQTEENAKETQKKHRRNADETQTTPIKEKEENKEEKEKKRIDMESRRNEFRDSLAPFVEIYGKKMMNEFYCYWIEPNKSNTKMRFELQQTWSTELRLKKWASKDNNFNLAKPKNYNPRA